MSALSKEQIRKLIKEAGLIRDYIDLETQLQPNGFDMTVGVIYRLDDVTIPVIDFSNAKRKLPEYKMVKFNTLGYAYLKPGYYIIQFNEVVKIPDNLMAIARPRSTLVRMGATVYSAVWDAGYEGRSVIGLHVVNPAGIRMYRNARVVQLVFFELNGVTDGYNGAYQGENI